MALQFEGRQTSYAVFDRHVDQVANGLVAEGSRKGTRIAYLGKNSDYYFEVLFGAARAGVVVAPLNWRLADSEIAYILADAGAEILFVGAEFAPRISKIRSALRSVIVMEEAEEVPFESYEHWRARHDTAPYPSNAAAEDIAIQMYTSGTTGNPKGAMLSHRALLAIRRKLLEHDVEWAFWTPDDVGLLTTPIGHIAGTGWGVMSLFFGAASVIAREFNPNDILDYITKDRISKLFLVPSALLIVLRQPGVREVDFSRLKCLLYGASPIPRELLREGLEVFGCGFAQQYGLTETSGSVVALTPEDHFFKDGAKQRAAGRPLPGVEIRIVDEDSRDLPTGHVGEIAIRSPGNMSGYWNQPEATRIALSPDGWLRTGDAGYIDEDGFLFIHDRVKDMIVSGGENVYPAEVENAIFGHPAILETAVIGVPDPKWGEAVKAVVVLREGATADAADIIRWARERIAAFKAPKSVDFVTSLPRNATGKVLRRELRAPYWNRADGPIG
jgi:long-chain acyl-CoA synthetase